jgi:chromosome segregation ATPase
MSDEEYITLEMAIKRLKVGRRQIYRYAEEKRVRVLPTKQGQMYHRGDVEDLAIRIKADERPARVSLDTPRPQADRAALNREIEELRGLRVELAQMMAEMRAQRQLTETRAIEAKQQDAQLQQAITELEATRAALTRPFYRQWGFWAAVLAFSTLLAVLALLLLR